MFRSMKNYFNDTKDASLEFSENRKESRKLQDKAVIYSRGYKDRVDSSEAVRP